MTCATRLHHPHAYFHRQASTDLGTGFPADLSWSLYCIPKSHRVLLHVQTRTKYRLLEVIPVAAAAAGVVVSEQYRAVQVSDHDSFVMRQALDLALDTAQPVDGV